MPCSVSSGDHAAVARHASRRHPTYHRAWIVVGTCRMSRRGTGWRRATLARSTAGCRAVRGRSRTGVGRLIAGRAQMRSLSAPGLSTIALWPTQRRRFAQPKPSAEEPRQQSSGWLLAWLAQLFSREESRERSQGVNLAGNGAIIAILLEPAQVRTAVRVPVRVLHTGAGTFGPSSFLLDIYSSS